MTGYPTMTERPVNRRKDTDGFSVVEVVVAMTIFSIVVLGLSATGAVAARDLNAGQQSTSTAAVVQHTADSLTSLGWAGLTAQSGSDTTQGHAVNWVISGDNPRSVVVVVQRQVMSATYADTVVTYVSK